MMNDGNGIFGYLTIVFCLLLSPLNTASFDLDMIQRIQHGTTVM
jgi:hypothetical protein